MKPYILLVDDDPRELFALSEVLRVRLHHARIEALTSPTAALALLSASDYDIIISDVIMPSMDGLTFLKQALALRPDAVVVLVTAGALEAEEEALVRGAFAFMTRPLDLERFFAMVAEALQQASLVRRVREQNRKTLEGSRLLSTSGLGVFSRGEQDAEGHIPAAMT
jgi:two-component system C4-dicarboxylate transport response regulator DctD